MKFEDLDVIAAYVVGSDGSSDPNRAVIFVDSYLPLLKELASLTTR